MGNNVHLLYDTRTWDAATVTASTSASGQGASRVLLDHPGRKWRSTSKTGNTLTFNLGSAFSTTLLGIFGHNFTSSATVTLAANSSSSFVTPAFGPTALTVATDADSRVLPRLVVKLSQTFRYWQISIDDPSNTSNYVEIGRVMGGQYYEFVRNFKLGARISHADATPITSVPGSLENITNLGSPGRYRQFRVDFPLRTVAEARKLQAVYDLVGQSRPVVLSLDIDNYPSERSAYCFFSSDLDLSWRAYSVFDVLTVGFEEKTR